MEEETWKSISGYDGIYEVSSLGRIKSLSRPSRSGIGNYAKKEKILKVGLNSEGYPTATLYKNGTKKTINVHQYVAISFLTHIPDGLKLVIDHTNGNKADNRVINLRIVTNRFNLSLGNRKDKNKFSSKYVGVCWSSKSRKWQSSIVISGKKKHLGIFINELDASEAYQNELLKLK